ncbi:MAG: MetQ/NlpA family ABC transporter substrate-binding protein [Firmicutes bacterium]|nr:MetQ/NlpA family ABC transporter substrate-binding protein [Bacillota bacterium]
MRKSITILTLVLSIALTSLAAAEEVLKVGVTPGPHEEIMEIVRDILADRGIKLKIVTFNDYIAPNIALAEGDIDANSFQHEPYLKRFAADRHLDLVKLAPTITFPIGIYSKKINSLDEIREHGVIAIPNDPTNGGRVLVLLEKAGLIKLRPGAGIEATVYDIVENPKNLVFKELDAALLPRALDDADAAAINTNYAVEAGLDPAKDPIYREGPDSPYVNIIAVRKGEEDRPIFKELVRAYHSQAVVDFVNKKYKGSLIPGFEVED